MKIDPIRELIIIISLIINFYKIPAQCICNLDFTMFNFWLLRI